jgi:hypothetical protein
MPVVVDLPDVPPTAIEIRRIDQLRREAAAASPVGSRAFRGHNIRHGVFDGGGGDEELLLTRDARAILRVEADAAGRRKSNLPAVRPGIQRPVGALDIVPTRLDDQGQRQHSAAADAAEEVRPGMF